MKTVKTVKPTDSYRLNLPDDVVEKVDNHVTSYWRPNESVALQISSYKREHGKPVPAKRRLMDLLARESLLNAVEEDLAPDNCPDVAAASAVDDEGIRWVYCFAVWPKLTVLASISGKADELGKLGGWAVEAVKSIQTLKV